MNLYIAGPMRGIEQFNFPAFDAAEEDLTERGFGVINPARHDREVYPDIEEWEGFKTGSLEDCPDFDFAAAMRWDLYALMACDGIVLLPGWQNSSGACLERSVANATGTQVWEYETMVRADMRYTADPVRDVTTDEVRVVRVVGGTDTLGAYPRHEAQRPENLAATIYRALGLPQTTAWHDDLDRPHYIYHGEPILGLT